MSAAGFATVMVACFAIGTASHAQERTRPGENVSAVLREEAQKLVDAASRVPANEAVPRLQLAADS
jgi:hypothetical protein